MFYSECTNQFYSFSLRKPLCVLLSFCLALQTTYAQRDQVVVHSLSEEDGLSSNMVYCAYQDKKGFLWIGTQAGLNRYDGQNIKVYDIFNTPSFSSNKVHSIIEDAEGNLWVGTYDGLMVLNAEGTVKTVYWHDPNNPNSISENRIRYLHLGKTGTIWIGTDNGTVERYLGNDKFELIHQLKSESDQLMYGTGITADPVNYIAEDSLGNLWIRDFDTGIFHLEKLPNSEGSKVDWSSTFMPSLKAIGITNHNEIWAINANGLLKYDYTKDAFFHQVDVQIDASIKRGVLIENQSGKFWLVDNNLWGEIDLITGAIETYFRPLAGAYLNIRADAIEDLTGLLWVTSKNGLVKLVPDRVSGFVQIPSSEMTASLPYHLYGMVEDDEGTVFMHAQESLLRMQGENYELETIQTIGGRCFELINDDSLIWAVNTSLGLCKINKDQKSISNFKLEFKTRFHSVLKDASGMLLVGTGAGIFSFDPKEEKFTRQCADERFIRVARIYKMIQSNDGTIWVACSRGLLKLNQDKELITHYNVKNHKKNGLLSNDLITVFEDQQGMIWLGSGTGGLIRFDPQNEKFVHFTKMNGLGSNSVRAITESNGLLWISTVNGLSWFDPEKKVFRNYFERDGLSSDKFNINSMLNSTNGTLYFGGERGINSFLPQNIIGNQKNLDTVYNVPILISSFTKFDEKKNKTIDLTARVGQKEELKLNYYDRNFNIQFKLADFRFPAEHKYEYLLEGLDENWHVLDLQSRIYLPSLPFGRYTLRVKAKNGRGTWSKNQFVIPLSMNRVFYKTPVFYFLLVVILLLAVYLFFRMRLHRLTQAKLILEQTITDRTSEILNQKDEIENDKGIIEKQAEKLKEFSEAQTRWFTNIAHELRTPLTLILGPIRHFLSSHTADSSEGIESIQLAEKNSVGLLRLVNEILDVSRLESSELKLNMKSTNLTLLVKESVAQFDSLAEQKGVTLIQQFNDEITLTIDRNRVQNILINLIFNALKFTHDGGQVTITVTHRIDHGIEVSVTDTGGGIPEKDVPFIFDRYYQADDPNRMNQGGTGIGLALCRELAELHNGHLAVISQLGSGSTFTLILPETSLVDSTKHIDQKGAAIDIPSDSRLSQQPTANSTIKTDSGEKPVLLLVDDNEDMRQYICSFMSADYDIIQAGDGLEALDCLKQSIPDLIICDVMMPRMDGVEFAKRIKDNENYSNIPFITLTAKATDNDKVETLRIGIDDYLTKPFNAEELQVRSANLIENYSARKTTIETANLEPIEPSHEQRLIGSVIKEIMSQLKNESFTIDDLAKSQHMSVSSLKRVLKKVSGMSPGKFVREIRLQEAQKMLDSKRYATVLEVAYAVGYENASHFSKLYLERFGKRPSEYL